MGEKVLLVRDPPFDVSGGCQRSKSVSWDVKQRWQETFSGIHKERLLYWNSYYCCGVVQTWSGLGREEEQPGGFELRIRGGWFVGGRGGNSPSVAPLEAVHACPVGFLGTL